MELAQAEVGGRSYMGLIREVPPSPVPDGASASGRGGPASPVDCGRRRHQPSVVVIGAGFAGLAAAEELHALGCKVTLNPQP